MNAELSIGRQSAAKDLASAPPFHLGPLGIDPASRRVVAIGRSQMLEPRVMRVLVALWEASGRVVTRDDLIELCWDGQIVTDNAITRVISLLRHALNDLGRETVQLETIAKVGYRLLVDDADDRVARAGEINAANPPTGPVLAGQGPIAGSNAPLPMPEASAGRDRRSFRARMLALVPLSILAAVFAFGWINNEPGFESPIQVEIFASGPSSDAKLLASNVRADVMDVLNRSRIATTESGSRDWLKLTRPASRILRAQVNERDRQVQVAVLLSDSATGTTLWSQNFSGRADESNELALQAAAAAVRTIYTTRDLDLQPGLSLSPEAVALYLEGNSALRNPQLFKEGVPRQIFEKLVARAPDSAAAHALLALALAHEGLFARPDELRSTFARARAEANRSFAISPAAAGAAFDAMYIISRMEHPDGFAQAERWLASGLRLAPGFAFVAMRQCRMLMELGRARDALLHCQRANALHPYAEPIEWSYAQALSMNGLGPQAVESIERTASHSPEHLMTRRTRLGFLLFEGDQDRARALLHNTRARPPELSDAVAAILDRVVVAQRASDASTDLPAQIVAAQQRGEMPFDLAVMALASLNRTDEAFALLHTGSALEVYGAGTPYLFRPVTAPLRADARFWPVAMRLGLAQYWVEKQAWPDFCGQEIPLAYCKREAARALQLANAR